MTLAAILVLLFFNPGSPSYAAQEPTAPAAQTQATSAQKPNPPSSASPTAKPTQGKKAHPKKAKTADCSTSANSGKSKSGSPNAAPNSGKPCPPRKVIVSNGGSDEPIVQLKNDTSPAKASDERLNTEQLRLVTQDNLKKIAGRQLTADQQQMVNQIKQFVDQSKAAEADGDLERGHNLAMKARLLSDELANP